MAYGRCSSPCIPSLVVLLNDLSKPDTINLLAQDAPGVPNVSASDLARVSFNQDQYLGGARQASIDAALVVDGVVHLKPCLDQGLLEGQPLFEEPD